MDIYIFSVIVLISLAVLDLIVGVSNDAVNFLNSSIGSRVAPRYIIMIIASLGILVGVTFSSGMMEVARKGIFHPEYFLMPELLTIFLAVMLTDILLLDLFNTFGLPTSTTVSIVFELLGAAVAVSLFKIYDTGQNLANLVQYINTGKALVIIMGILLSVVIAFIFGAITQFLSRLVFTFDYHARLKRYGGLWGGLCLSIITYFILIKGAKGTSFLSPESVAWIKTHTWVIFSVSFVFFGVIFQLLLILTKINILKPIILIGTFALAMAFAANDLVNFIGVPLAGLSAFGAAQAAPNPLSVTMEALKQPIQSNTFLLLIAGAIMVATLWLSRKARTVSKTELSLGRQDEGIERFGSSAISRTIVGMAYASSRFITWFIPIPIRRAIANRADPGAYVSPQPGAGQKTPSFDLLRASVNLMVASAVVSFATSLKLPLSTTYVTFMVSMGTSFSDRAWGRDSAVYRITGVLTVIGGWFFTALAAFSVSCLFASIISFFKFPGMLGLVTMAIIIIVSSYRWHFEKERKSDSIETLSMEYCEDPAEAVKTVFEQTGKFLKETSDTLGLCIEAAVAEDKERLRSVRSQTSTFQQRADIIVANIFKTLSLLGDEDIRTAQNYSHTIGSLQTIVENHSDTIQRLVEHFENFHPGFNQAQKNELRQVKTHITRLLWNTSIMLLFRKKVDYNYIANQSRTLNTLVNEFDRNQIMRIQNAESTTRLSILFYGVLGNVQEIAKQTQDLLDIFRSFFEVKSRGQV